MLAATSSVTSKVWMFVARVRPNPEGSAMHKLSSLRQLVAMIAFLSLSGPVFAQERSGPRPSSPEVHPDRTVTIEAGGTGPFSAIATEETGLPGMTIFRPNDLAPFGGENRLPVLLWGNGACANSAEEHKNFLNEIASHGYLVLAIGPLDQLEKRGPAARERTSAEQLTKALDWIEAEIAKADSKYAGKVDATKVAAMGMSCGGLQAIAISADPRIDTTVVCNSGILPTPSPMAAMPALKKEDLQKYHGPVIYIMGGPTDIAYKNAMDDYSRVNQVPIVMANHDVGHGGTYRQPHGGQFTRVALAWLNWQLKNEANAGQQFLDANSDLRKDSKWTIEAKNFE
jgi:hypothetical protein